MGNSDQVYLSISNEPRAILKVMDDLLARNADRAARTRGRSWIPPALFLAGIPFVCVDLALGYQTCLFSLAAAGLWIAALATFVAWTRELFGPSFPPHYHTARQVIHTLRDDLQPKQNFLGHLDLTGPQQPGKLAREGKNALGLTVNFYRDDWLSLKAKLYDGNLLRLSAIERVKVRLGYNKRGRISGKPKWKPPKVGNEQELDVRIAVNPQVYEIVPQQIDARAGVQVGRYWIGLLNTADGILRVTAAARATTIQPADILGVLKFAYAQLKRKGQP